MRAKPRFGLLAVHSDGTTLPEHPSRDSSRRGIQKQPGTAHTLLLTRAQRKWWREAQNLCQEGSDDQLSSASRNQLAVWIVSSHS